MLYGKKINQIKISKEENMNPRIQGRVAPEKYDLYKKTKKEYIQKTGEIVTDGEFLLLCLEAFIEQQSK